MAPGGPWFVRDLGGTGPLPLAMKKKMIKMRNDTELKTGNTDDEDE